MDSPNRHLHNIDIGNNSQDDVTGTVPQWKEKKHMAIVVTTPTGHIGRKIVEYLLDQNAEVAVIVRDPAKLAPEVRERAIVHQGDLYDTAFVQKVTEGADALFWLTPPNYTAPDWKASYVDSAASAVAAINANRLPYVIHLSSAGADRSSGFGPVSFLHLVENALNETDAHVLHLRPTYFYENYLSNLDTIKTHGAIYSPIPASISYPMIATKDIAAVAARRLQAKDWSGKEIMGLHGPAEQPTFGEAATIIGEAIGKPIQYIEVPLESVKPQLLQIGFSESVASIYPELLDALARNEQPAEPRTPETTTPTTLREWATETLRPLI